MFYISLDGRKGLPPTQSVCFSKTLNIEGGTPSNFETQMGVLKDGPPFVVAKKSGEADAYILL